MATPPHKVRYEAKATTNRAHKTTSSARLRLAKAYSTMGSGTGGREVRYWFAFRSRARRESLPAENVAAVRPGRNGRSTARAGSVILHLFAGTERRRRDGSNRDGTPIAAIKNYPSHPW